METKIDTSNQFLTSDLGLAAFLVCSEVTLRDINRTNIKRAVFIFDNKPELVKAYQSGKGQVSALAYYNAFQTLKNELWRAG